MGDWWVLAFRGVCVSGLEWGRGEGVCVARRGEGVGGVCGRGGQEGRVWPGADDDRAASPGWGRAYYLGLSWGQQWDEMRRNGQSGTIRDVRPTPQFEICAAQWCFGWARQY